jgi:hypothetical protein
MKYFGTDKKQYSLTLDPQKNGLREQGACKSKIQYACGQWLKEKYKFAPILEELYITSEGVYLDFFLPYQKLAVEVQGRQHEKHVPFFQNKREFAAQIERDNKKSLWCEINGIKLLTVKSVEELSCLLQ